MYLSQLVITYGGQILPEFPTGNGKIDLLIRYADTIYGLEVKSFVNQRVYQEALLQAVSYGIQLPLPGYKQGKMSKLSPSRQTPPDKLSKCL